MYFYKQEIKSGPLLEVKYYKSLRKRNLKNIGRSTRKGLTPEKQKKANKKRAELNAQRLLLCNFEPGDWFMRFSAPYHEWTEERFEKEITNFFRRIKTRCKKLNIDFKYIGFTECGKLGKNWHLHICIQKEVMEIAKECWYYPEGINLTPMYQKGDFKDLAKYIHKDVCGSKRLKTSRNLDRPEVQTSRCNKKTLRKLEHGDDCAVLKPYNKEYHLVSDDRVDNDYTGANFYFAFLSNNFISTVKRRE